MPVQTGQLDWHKGVGQCCHVGVSLGF
jgi:hypothetical protein